MYAAPKLAFKYLQYLLTAANGRGHGVHSPFIYAFIEKVLRADSGGPALIAVERVRQAMLRHTGQIDIVDYGAGSRVDKSNKRRVQSIARTALKPAKYGKLMHRITAYFGCKSVVELGTSLGITTAYMALAPQAPAITTLEGAPMIAQLARKNFETLGLSNIIVKEGNFDNNLKPLLEEMKQVDLVYIDGNHRCHPTIQYFNWILPHVHNDTILVFDDIHWSSGMEKAWETIKSHEAVTLTIDLFFIGLVFFRQEQKTKQHVTIRF